MRQKAFFILFVVCILSVGAHAQAVRVIENHTLFSDALSENRIISVALPEHYHRTDKSYPVLYVLDGEYVFSYAIGTMDFISNPFGSLPEAIVVSIPNTDRNRDMFVNLSPDGDFLHFIDFLTQEVLPYVNRNYRTNGLDLLYGWSSASGICIYLFSANPEVFDGYITSGTGIGPRSEAFMRSKIPGNNYKNTYFYASTESEGPRVDALLRLEELLKDLNPPGVRWKVETPETPSHVEMLSKGIYDGLNFIFSDFYVPDSITVQGLSGIISYFTAISKNYNVEIEIPEGIFNELASILSHGGKNEAAIELLLHGTTVYPESPLLFGSLGDLYKEMEQNELAAKYYKTAMEKSAHDMVSHNKYRLLLFGLE